MPELPEVETTRRGIAPHLTGRRVEGVVVRQPRLRRPVPPDLADHLGGQPLQAVDRRGKYLLLCFPPGELIIHLGMSGSLRVLQDDPPAGPHDHLDLRFDGDRLLRLHDPRRFGWVDWQPRGTTHPWLARLGPEPLGEDFHDDWLSQQAAGRRRAIKSLVMDSAVVVGVGNIYANEALWRAGIHPHHPAGDLARPALMRLVGAIRQVLQAAIDQGGTTLRDFTRADGRPGYFAQSLAVYGRAGQACLHPGCDGRIEKAVIVQRASYFCPRCQPPP